ncbi:MAG TPA: TolC family protein [Vicinamibacterales bacterium]|nr:TolC family protein [Vicinamibacterales bacterium]
MIKSMRGVWVRAFAVSILLPAAAWAQSTTPATAQSPQTPPIDRYVVGQAKPPDVPGTTQQDLTLEQAVQMSLEKNLSLQVAKLGPQLADYSLQSARAAFLPRYTSRYSINNSTNPSNNVLQGVVNVTQNTQNFDGTFAQLLPWHGGNFSVNFTNSRQGTNDVTARVNPAFNSRLSFSYTQPLLAGFKMDGTRNELRTVAIQRQIADIQLLTTIENLRADVRQAYWTLRSAIEQIEIQRRLLQLALRSWEDSKIRVQIGSLAPIETLQFESQAASAEQALLDAQIRWRTAELNLKLLLASGADDDIYKATLNPVDQPQISVQAVDIPGAVTGALSQRSDLVQQRKNLDINQLLLEVTKDRTRPQLDLSSGYNTSGQGGTRFSSGVITEESGYSGALRQLGTFDTSGWNTQLNFTVPFGRDWTTNRVAYARQVLQLDQTKANIKAAELRVSAEVTNAGLAIENTYKQYQAAQTARSAAERNAEAAQTRFENGVATNFEVVTLQNTLTNARLTELSRLIAYVNAIAEFERIQRVGR